MAYDPHPERTPGRAQSDAELIANWNFEASVREVQLPPPVAPPPLSPWMRFLWRIRIFPDRARLLVARVAWAIGLAFKRLGNWLCPY